MSTAHGLLVDDDVELTGMLRASREREGFPVVAANDSQTGIAEALSGRHQLVTST